MYKNKVIYQPAQIMYSHKMYIVVQAKSIYQPVESLYSYKNAEYSTTL